MKTIKKITLIFTFCLLPFAFYLSSDTWVKTYRPFQEPYRQDKYWIEDVIITQDSGYVVSGSFELCGEYYWERWGFLMKTDKDGNVLWTVKDSVDFMSDNGDFVDFVETSDGDFITIGSRIPSGGYMIKRDNEGNRLWDMSYTSFGTKSMYNTADNNIILGGVVNSNIALRKIDNNGNALWTKSYNCGNFSMANSIKETSEDDYILTGLASGTGYDIIVLKTNSIGDSLWKRTFEGLGGHDIGNCIIETNENNILAGGWIINDGHNGFVWLLDHYGNTLWNHIYNDGILYYILSLLQTSDDNFVLQGGKLVKIDYTPNVIWNEPLTGDVFGGGDKNLQRTAEGGFLCVATEDYGDYIVLNKTDSLGQVYSIDEPGNENNILINVFPNPILDNCEIILNNHNASLKNPTIMIYNIKGQHVRDCGFQISDFGFSTVWDGKDFNGKEVQNGIYFLKLESDNYTTVKKITKIK